MGGRQSTVGSVWIIIVILLLASGATSSGCTFDVSVFERRPRLVIDDSVAGDFEALAIETWDRFLTVFQARAGCFGDVRLRATRTLDSRAVYDPDDATVTVRVPGTPAMLQSALVHEWAHHIEFQCEAHKEFRRAFLAAQGLPPDTVWRPDNAPAEMPTSEWADIPSEQYAEATVALVLGDRPIPTKARITRKAIRVIAEWAAGD
ncbi:MAG: hypothetical protein V3S14_00225 [Anaerolineae bacterium]